MESTISNQKGMTLIEVLAALVLLSMMTITLFTVVTTSTIWIFKAGKSTQAMNMANTIMEDIKANSNTIPVGTFPHNMLSEDIKDNGLGLSGDYRDSDKWGNMKAEVKVSEMQFDSTSRDNLLEVKVKVTWQDSKGNYMEELTSIISRR